MMKKNEGEREMNETMEMILSRRSVRSYRPEMPKREELEQIVEAGLYAATGRGVQSAIIVAITNRSLRDRLSEMNRQIGGWQEGFDPFFGAPALLLVLSDKNDYNHVCDGALVMGNMMLAAHALGLGSCWINRARQEFETEEGKAILKSLGIEGEYEGIGHLIVGYPAGAAPKPAPRKPGRVFWAE